MATPEDNTPSKRCTKCGEYKARSEFNRKAANKDGLQTRCRSCTATINAAWYAANTERGRAYARSWRAANPNGHRDGQLKREYGIGFAEWTALFAQQGGACAICNAPLSRGTGGAGVDHCHRTGVVRSLLCRPCNTGLGGFKDDPSMLRAAAAYIEHHKEVEMMANAQAAADQQAAEEAAKNTRPSLAA